MSMDLAVIMITDEITALMQLASPALPIGGYSYSQGLEAAIDSGMVTDPVTATQWVEELFLGVFAHGEAPLWLLSYEAWARDDVQEASAWNDYFMATRETSELRMETEQMGWSLLQLAGSLDWGQKKLEHLRSIKPLSLMTAHSYSALHLKIQAHNGLTAYGFSWLENQVAAAVKAIPLGQVAGQRMLTSLRTAIPKMITEATKRANANPPIIENFSPMMAILSSRHETQYSRLFRS